MNILKKVVVFSLLLVPSITFATLGCRSLDNIIIGITNLVVGVFIFIGALFFLIGLIIYLKNRKKEIKKGGSIMKWGIIIFLIFIIIYSILPFSFFKWVKENYSGCGVHETEDRPFPDFTIEGAPKKINQVCAYIKSSSFYTIDKFPSGKNGKLIHENLFFVDDNRLQIHFDRHSFGAHYSCEGDEIVIDRVADPELMGTAKYNINDKSLMYNGKLFRKIKK